VQCGEASDPKRRILCSLEEKQKKTTRTDSDMLAVQADSGGEKGMCREDVERPRQEPF
jgi:hypothetical protein